jgi:hypothetical protein
MIASLVAGLLWGAPALAAELRVSAPTASQGLRRDQLALVIEVVGDPMTTYAVHINGDQATVVLVTDGSGRAQSQADVTIYPLLRARVIQGERFGEEVPDHEIERLYRVITLDLWGPVQGSWSKDPLDRERIVVTDLRTWHDEAEPLLEPDELMADGLAVSLTSEGLALLATSLLAELPAAPLAALDSVLADRIGGGVAIGEWETPQGTCVPYLEAPAALQEALAPQVAFALGAAATVPVCKRALDMSFSGLWQTAVLAHGYEPRPSLGVPADLAICVEALGPVLVDLWTRGQMIGLASGDEAVLAETWHLGPAGLVDVELDAWLVYKDGIYEHGPCPVVAAQALPPELATCPEVLLGASWAGGPAVSLTLEPSSDGAQANVDQDTLSASVLWDPWLDPSADPLCGHPILAAPVSGLVEPVGIVAAEMLDSAWDAGAPEPTQLSAGLEALLGSWKLVPEEEDGVGVDAVLTQIVELRSDPIDETSPQGITAFYDTVAEPLEPWALNEAAVFAPEILPWPDTGALSWWGTALHFRMAVSIGSVNQVLAAAAPTDVLAGSVDLAGVDLATLVPELADRGILQAELRWPVAPALTTEASEAEGDDRLLMHIAGAELVIYAKGSLDTPLLVLAIDAMDTDFELALGETDGLLESDLVLTQLAVGVLAHDLDRWPSEDGLAERLRPWIAPLLADRIQDAVALMPIPEMQGLVSPLRLVEVEDPFVGGEVVLFSARIEGLPD